MTSKHPSAFVGKQALVALLLVIVTSACGAPAPQQASSSGSAAPAASPAPSASPRAAASAAGSAAPSASTAASVTPAASAAPVTATSAVPSARAAASSEPGAGGGVLPAPLLFLRAGDIVRLERDGTTITQLTAEQAGQPDMLAVTDFDVSPADGSLIYVVQTAAGNVLVRADADGQQRTLLLPNASVNTPRWSPDGSQIAFLSITPPEHNTGMVPGVYVLPAAGGTPRLLQPNDTADPATPSVDARAYSPVAWSPDGTKLLLSGYSQTVEVCSAFVKDLPSGALVPIQAPEGLVSGCASGRWSPDGTAIYIGMARPGPQPPVPGLWTADPATGTITPFLQGQVENGTYRLVTNYHPREDGSVYAFVAEVQTLPDPFGGQFPAYTLAHSRPTDSEVLRPDPIVVSGQALWAPDASGVVVDIIKPSINDVVTAWVPLAGGPLVELGPFMGEAKHWAQQ